VGASHIPSTDLAFSGGGSGAAIPWGLAVCDRRARVCPSGRRIQVWNYLFSGVVRSRVRDRLSLMRGPKTITVPFRSESLACAARSRSDPRRWAIRGQAPYRGEGPLIHLRMLGASSRQWKQLPTLEDLPISCTGCYMAMGCRSSFARFCGAVGASAQRGFLHRVSERGSGSISKTKAETVNSSIDSCFDILPNPLSSISLGRPRTRTQIIDE